MGGWGWQCFPGVTACVGWSWGILTPILCHLYICSQGLLTYLFLCISARSPLKQTVRKSALKCFLPSVCPPLLAAPSSLSLEETLVFAKILPRKSKQYENTIKCFDLLGLTFRSCRTETYKKGFSIDSQCEKKINLSYWALFRSKHQGSVNGEQRILFPNLKVLGRFMLQHLSAAFCLASVGDWPIAQ